MPKAKIAYVVSPAGDEKVAMSGRIDLPLAAPAIDPIANGFEFAEYDAMGNLVFVRTIGGGLASASGLPGWTVNSRGTTWKFKDRDGVLAAGVSRVVVKRAPSRGPNAYSFKISAKGEFALQDLAQVPVRLHVALGGRDQFVNGLCGSIDFAGPGQPSPACSVLSSGSLLCK